MQQISFMNLEAKQIYKSPRWITLYVALGMMTIGYMGFEAFNYLGKFVHQGTPPNIFDGPFDVPCILCVLLAACGALVCLGCCFWIFIVAFHSSFLRRNASDRLTKI